MRLAKAPTDAQLAHFCEAWARAWFWQIYRNQPDVYDVRDVLLTVAKKLNARKDRDD